MSNVLHYLRVQLTKLLRDAPTLKVLCYNLHLIITVILLIQNIPITIYRYLHYPEWVTWVNLGEISIFLLAIILFLFKKYDLSVLISGFGLPILFGTAIFTLSSSIDIVARAFRSGFWFLLSFMLIYTLIIRDKPLRTFYLLFVMAMFFIPGILISFNYPENIIKFIQISTVTIIPFIISSFIEQQDAKISNLNTNLNNRITEKEKLSRSLKEKNKELVTFAHIMSHDLKAPLRTISSFAKIIRTTEDLKPHKKEEYFEYM